MGDSFSGWLSAAAVSGGGVCQAAAGHDACFSQRRFVTQHVVVVLGETMGFVANVLQQPQGVSMTAQSQRFFLTGDEDLFLALGQRQHDRRLDVEGSQCCQAGIELPLAAVDEQDVGEDLSFVVQAFESAGHDLVDAGEVVDALHAADAKPLVAWLEGHAVDELHEAGHGLAAGQVGNVDAFDCPRLVFELQDLLQPRQPALGIDIKHLGLHVRV